MLTALLATALPAFGQTAIDERFAEPDLPTPNSFREASGRPGPAYWQQRADYSIRATPGQVLQFRRIGALPVERTVGADATVNVQLQRAVTSLNAVVVTALGTGHGQEATRMAAVGTATPTYGALPLGSATNVPWWQKGRLHVGDPRRVFPSTAGRASLVIVTDRAAAVWWRSPTVEVLRAAFAHTHAGLRALGPDLLADDFDATVAVARETPTPRPEMFKPPESESARFAESTVRVT